MIIYTARKKPVEVKCMRYAGDDNEQEIIEWTKGVCHIGCDGDKNSKVVVQTLEGLLTVSVGDYIIQGVNGEFYPCKPDIFEKTYDLVGIESCG